MRHLVLSFIFLLSCSSTSKKVDPMVEEAAKSIASTIEFSISKGGETGIVVKGGEVFLSGTLVGKINGSQMMDTEGNLLATHDENRILDSKGQTLILLDEKGRLDNGSDELIRWSKDGNFFAGEEDLGFVVEPNDPSLYRTASFVLFLHLFPQQVLKESPSEIQAELAKEDERLERLYGKRANTKCNTEIPWSIDWKSFEGQNDRRLSEEATSSVYAACGVPLDRLGDVCGDDDTNRIKQMVSSFRCVLGTNKLHLVLEKGKLEYYVDFEANDAYDAFDSFLVKKRLVETKPKPKELTPAELEKIRQILGGGRKVQQCYKACAESSKTTEAAKECRARCD